MPMPMHESSRFVPERRHVALERRHIRAGTALRDWVFGSNDGLIAAFAVTSGVYGARVASVVVFAGGIAELVGGTISMGLGAYLATKSHNDYVLAERAREEREVDETPEAERDEIRKVYSGQGFAGDVLDRIVTHVTADRGRWITTMMREELGLDENLVHPLRVGAATGIAYAVGAAVPVLPYALPLAPEQSFTLSTAGTILALFFAGALKAIATGRRWLPSGAENLVIGTLAGGATFLAGWLVGTHR